MATTDTSCGDGRLLLDRLGPGPLFALAEHCDRSGIRLHLVGGPVRDLLAGMVPKDLDVTSAATPERFRAVVEAFSPPGDSVAIFDVGEQHGTTGVRVTSPDGTVIDIEHTTHRTETYEGSTRTPTVSFGTDLVADLARRDFTLNAVAIDIVSGELTDPFGGIDDLAAGVLRCPDDPQRIFAEDPLRICRLVRFAALRGFVPDADTAAAATLVKGRLAVVSAERVSAELERVLTSGAAALARAARLCDALSLSTEVLGVSDAARLAVIADRVAERGTADVCDADALAALCARTSSDAPGWCRAMKVTNSRRSFVGAVNRLMDHPGAVAARKAGRGATAVAALLSVDSDAALLAAFAADDALFAELPVNGFDCIEAGLSGRSIGEALSAVTAAHCAAPPIGRDVALDIIAAMA